MLAFIEEAFFSEISRTYDLNKYIERQTDRTPGLKKTHRNYFLITSHKSEMLQKQGQKLSIRT